MKSFLVLLFVLPLTAGEFPSLGIFLNFAESPSASILEDMKREISSRLAPRKMDLHWRLVQENRGTEPFDRLVVVRFRGRCIPRPALTSLDDTLPFTERVTLAATAVTDGHVLPYSEVDCDQIRKSLGQKVLAFGRALGVVVAHEMEHILRNSMEHAKAGWMRPALDWKDLTQKGGQANLPPASFAHH
jgi:hypothetical protein